MRTIFVALLFCGALALPLILGYELRGDVFLALIVVILLFNGVLGLALWISAIYYTQRELEEEPENIV